MWERIAYPRARLPQVYDITYFDAQGEEIEKDGQFHLLARDVEREVQFRERAEEMGADTHHVHLMTPEEIWGKIREEEGSLLDQYLRFVAETIGLDKALTTLPLVMRHQETITPTL